MSEEAVCIEGADVSCFRIKGDFDEPALQDWALHIRRHYVRDAELYDYLKFYEQDSAEFLRSFKIPDVPQIKSGDFAEIIISDLLQFIKGYEVPRYKQHGRVDKNQSERGTDVIAYKINDLEKPSKNDELIAVEVKSRSSSTDLKGAISEAAKDSPKDKSRLAMTLAYYSARSLNAGDVKTSTELKRFLDAGEHPFTEKLAIGAVAGIDNAKKHLEGKSASDLFITNGQSVFIIHRTHLMDLIHEIYSRCVS